MFYLIQGDDEYLITSKRDELLARFMKSGDVAIERYDGKDGHLTLTDLYHAVSTLSFFEPKKIVILDNAGDLFERDKSFLSKDGGKRIINDMLSIGDDVLIILSSFEKAINRATSVYKLIKEKGQVIELKKLWHDPNEGLKGDLLNWIQTETAKRNLKLSPDQLAAIIMRVGSDLRQITNELDKIAMYLGDEPASKLSFSVLNKLIAPSRELVIFNLIDAVAQKNLKRAIAYVTDLISSGAADSYIITMLHRQFRQIYNWQILSKQGLSDEEKVAELGLSPFTKRKIIAQTAKFPQTSLPGVISALINADEEVKNSYLPSNIILEKLVIRLAG